MNMTQRKIMYDMIQPRRKRPPLAPGEKEKLTRDQQRADRLRRLKQVRFRERVSTLIL